MSEINSEIKQLHEAAELASTLEGYLIELSELTKRDQHQDMLNCGLHLLSTYEKLMKAVESSIHPVYIKRIEEFRKTIPRIGE